METRQDASEGEFGPHGGSVIKGGRRSGGQARASGVACTASTRRGRIGTVANETFRDHDGPAQGFGGATS